MIAFEYDGNFWHGNPNIYPTDQINKVTKTTFEHLYEQTMEKRRNLEKLGWLVISIWECVYDSGIILTPWQIEEIEL